MHFAVLPPLLVTNQSIALASAFLDRLRRSRLSSPIPMTEKPSTNRQNQRDDRGTARMLLTCLNVLVPCSWKPFLNNLIGFSVVDPLYSYYVEKQSVAKSPLGLGKAMQTSTYSVPRFRF